MITATMPEEKADAICPVRCFETYLKHLHPGCDWLWQRPREKSCIEGQEAWFYKQWIGDNTLKTFISKLSTSTELSAVYTNHSIRVTGATLLKRSMFSDKQVMLITGHKSVNSLALYKKVSTDQKLMMGRTVNKLLGMKCQPTAAIGAPPKKIPKIDGDFIDDNPEIAKICKKLMTKLHQARVKKWSAFQQTSYM